MTYQLDTLAALSEGVEPEEALAPGKRTLTDRLASRSLQARSAGAQAMVDPRPAVVSGADLSPGQSFVDSIVQFRAAPSAAERAQVPAQEIAAQGLTGAPHALPFQEQIQASFGHHSVTGIGAHVGGAAGEAADALGAHAYAMGSSVAFAGTPDLHTAAHEAAHVIQQRAGISLKGGAGQAGDDHEQHADAVADRVVRGESAASLLDQYASTCGAVVSSAVQRTENPAAAATPAAATTAQLSGAAWCAKFPGSKSLDDLKGTFEANAKEFIAAMEAAGADVDISATFRPNERSYLMYTSAKIARGELLAKDAKAYAGVDINWVHPTDAASITAAKAMETGYGTTGNPVANAGGSRHNYGAAVDMDISWSGTLKIKEKSAAAATPAAPAAATPTAPTAPAAATPTAPAAATPTAPAAATPTAPAAATDGGAAATATTAATADGGTATPAAAAPAAAEKEIKTTPRDGVGNTELHAVGAGYGVKKKLDDKPHWSDTGG